MAATAGLNKPIPFTSKDYSKQSVPVPGTKRPGQSAHYRNGAFGLTDLETPGSFKTLTEVFDTGLALSKDRNFLGYRPKLSTNPDIFANHYVWQTYAEIDARRRAVGSAIAALFQEGVLGGGEMDTVGIWSQNRPEWQIIELACQAYKKVSISLYDTLGKDSVEYIIDHAHLTVVFATSQHVPTLLRLAPKVPMLKLIVSIDDLSPELKGALSAWGESQNVQVKDLRELEADGRAHPLPVIPATPNQVASICYTSGTTSTPKGVILTHGHLAVAVQSNLHGFEFPGMDLRDLTLMSYLPLAHIYERVFEILAISVGGRIGYFSGDPLRLLEDAQILRPHVFPSVPRVLNRVYQAAMVAGSAPGLKGAIFRKAVQAKLDKLHATGDNTHVIWDKLVFRKIQAVLGGNLKMVTSGSAPINPGVMDFLKIAFACEVTEGDYGMTENCATCARCWPGDPSSSGTVGATQPANEIKLIDVPHMGYSAEDKPNPRGELCSRGACCFSIYYKDEKNTAATVDSEGWIHTGDVAEIDSCGRIKIIDRVKNIMKLAQGEYVALEKIENLYSASPMVGQLYLHGDSLQSYLVAVIIPDPAQLAALASSVTGTKVSPEDRPALEQALNDPRINKAVLDILTKEANRNGLRGFETIKRIHLSLDLFTVDEGTLTPTMKIRRKDAYNKFKKELDALYTLGEVKL